MGPVFKNMPSDAGGKPTVLLTKGHGCVSPHEEFHLEFLCATELRAVALVATEGLSQAWTLLV